MKNRKQNYERKYAHSRKSWIESWHRKMMKQYDHLDIQLTQKGKSQFRDVSSFNIDSDFEIYIVAMGTLNWYSLYIACINQSDNVYFIDRRAAKSYRIKIYNCKIGFFLLQIHFNWNKLREQGQKSQSFIIIH